MRRSIPQPVHQLQGRHAGTGWRREQGDAVALEGLDVADQPMASQVREHASHRCTASRGDVLRREQDVLIEIEGRAHHGRAHGRGADGAWVGSVEGFWTDEDSNLRIVLAGEGAYEGLAAYIRGRFWDYRRVLHANQGGINAGAFSLERLADMAEAAGIDREAFLPEMEQPTYLEAVEAETAQAMALGITAVPALVINGVAMTGLPSWESPASAIEAALASASPRVSPASSAAPSAEPSPTALVHHRVGRLGLDHPATWTVRSVDVSMRHMRVIEFIGTASSTAGCTTLGDLTTRGVDLALEPGTVSVAVEGPGGPMMPDAFERAENPPPGTTVVAIDGVPALLTREADPVDPAATVALALLVPDPERVHGGSRLRAEVRGPGEVRLWEQVEDLLASVHYEPALRATSEMDEGAAAAAAREAIDRLAEGDRAFACFPREPGRSRRAVVREVPFYSRLTRRLPVTCSTVIEGTPLELWKMTLTSAWKRGPGRSAGSLTTTIWVGLEGEPTTSTGGPGGPPYWP